MARPPTTTPDGLDETMQTNYLGPFFLTSLLMPNMRESWNRTGLLSRVVCVASGMHRYGKCLYSRIGTPSSYRRFRAYADSKLCLTMFVAELDRRFGASGLAAVSVRPGTVSTGITRNSAVLKAMFFFLRPFLTSVEEAATAVVGSVDDPDLRSGGYYDRERPRNPSPESRDPYGQRTLWEATRSVIQDKTGMRVFSPDLSRAQPVIS
ncbi:unnamed protein product [Chrysoparadoxa australica]